MSDEAYEVGYHISHEEYYRRQSPMPDDPRAVPSEATASEPEGGDDFVYPGDGDTLDVTLREFGANLEERNPKRAALMRFVANRLRQYERTLDSQSSRLTELEREKGELWNYRLLAEYGQQMEPLPKHYAALLSRVRALEEDAKRMWQLLNDAYGRLDRHRDAMLLLAINDHRRQQETPSYG